MIVIDNWNWPQFVMLFIFALSVLTGENDKGTRFMAVSVELIILTFGGFFK